MDDEEKQKKLDELIRQVEERDKGTLKGEGFIVHFNFEEGLKAAREVNERKRQLFEKRRQEREAKKRQEASKQTDSEE